MKRVDQKFIENAFAQKGCKLIDVYVRSHKKMKFICKCGRQGEKSWSNFKNGHIFCYWCQREKYGNNSRKYSISDVRKILKENNCTLLSKRYSRSTDSIEYRCHCGKLVKKKFVNFLKNKKCKNCKLIEKPIYANGIKFKREISEIRKFFENNSCKLLDNEYGGYDKKLRFICGCGDLCEKTLARFVKYPACSHCCHKNGVKRDR